ncbi:hypothetical protein [Flavobacterium covae]|uniref:hypothetical protein n=1 Tax=Flavobacterium covae TaxID=2906076 RepID=UPI000745C53B|nr:hypothetical protein [Flavobacterium covae]AMA48972.1 hypothetical protein AWN65_05595 [Flavobacterium covae]MCJ1809891.1 hypothetical protein [Flavobacterium covae]
MGDIYKKYITYETTEDKLHNLISEIGRKTYDVLENTDGRRENIKILMPEWLKELIINYNRANVSINLQHKSNEIYGCEVLPNYQNEIVIYNKYFNPKHESTHYIIIL